MKTKNDSAARIKVRELTEQINAASDRVLESVRRMRAAEVTK